MRVGGWGLEVGGQLIRRSRRLGILILILTSILHPLTSIFAAPSSLEMSEKYSQDLQQRFQKHLDQIFGPGKSEVFVSVTLGFSKEMQENFQTALKAFLAWQMQMMAEAQQKSQKAAATLALSPEAKAAAEPAAGPGLPDSAVPGASAPAYVLPGYVVKRMIAMSEYKPTNYETSGEPQVVVPEGQGAKESQPQLLQPILPFYDTAFLYSIGSEVKKVVVKVVLDESLPPEAEVKAQALIGSAVDLDPGRGDQLIVSRMMLVPTKPGAVLSSGMIKLVGDPQFLGPLLQWTFLGGALFCGLVLGSMVLRNLSLDINLGSLPSWLGGALSIVHRGENQPAAAGVGPVGLVTGPGGEIPVSAGGSVIPISTVSRPMASNAIGIPIEKIGELYSLVGQSDAARIALIATRLDPKVSAEFLKRFDETRLSQILAAMSSPQYVDPAILARLKEEVERRVQGLVGGQDDILKVLELPDQKNRERILKALEENDPHLYRELRGKVLLLEDMLLFEDNELGLILQRAPVEDLAVIIRDTHVEQSLKDKILNCLARRTAAVVAERSSLIDQPAEDQASRIQGRVMAVAESLLRQGLIRPPAKAAEAGA